MTDPRFKPYDPEKPLLLAPDMRKWLPEDHLAMFISDVVDALDLSEASDKYYRSHGANRHTTLR